MCFWVDCKIVDGLMRKNGLLIEFLCCRIWWVKNCRWLDLWVIVVEKRWLSLFVICLVWWMRDVRYLSLLEVVFFVIDFILMLSDWMFLVLRDIIIFLICVMNVVWGCCKDDMCFDVDSLIDLSWRWSEVFEFFMMLFFVFFWFFVVWRMRVIWLIERLYWFCFFFDGLGEFKLELLRKCRLVWGSLIMMLVILLFMWVVFWVLKIFLMVLIWSEFSKFLGLFGCMIFNRWVVYLIVVGLMIVDILVGNLKMMLVWVCFLFKFVGLMLFNVVGLFDVELEFEFFVFLRGILLLFGWMFLRWKCGVKYWLENVMEEWLGICFLFIL